MIKKYKLILLASILTFTIIPSKAFGSNMTYTEEFKADGDIQLERVDGHTCNTKFEITEEEPLTNIISIVEPEPSTPYMSDMSSNMGFGDLGTIYNPVNPYESQITPSASKSIPSGNQLTEASNIINIEFTHTDKYQLIASPMHIGISTEYINKDLRYFLYRLSRLIPELSKDEGIEYSDFQSDDFYIGNLMPFEILEMLSFETHTIIPSYLLSDEQWWLCF